MFIVTIKLPRNKNHNPKNKKTGTCPIVHNNGECTDVTGEHHSFIGWGTSAEQVREFFSGLPYNYHVTRVEGTYKVL